MVPFQAIDLLIRQNTILPRRRSTAGAGNNVIDIAFVWAKLFPGVLAFPSVSFPNPSGRKLWPALRDFIVTSQHQNRWDPNQTSNRPNSVILFTSLEFQPLAPTNRPHIPRTLNVQGG